MPIKAPVRQDMARLQRDPGLFLVAPVLRLSPLEEGAVGLGSSGARPWGPHGTGGLSGVWGAMKF